MFSWIQFVDHSLYLKFNESCITVLLIYVDDVILAGDDKDEINVVSDLLNSTFRIKILGNLTCFLGFEIARNKGIHLCQRKYTLDNLKEAGMLRSAPMSTPMNFSKHKITNTGEPLADPTPFRRFLGHLIYLTHTRSYITFVVHHLSQFIVAPTTLHHQASMRILCYLKHHPR